MTRPPEAPVRSILLLAAGSWAGVLLAEPETLPGLTYVSVVAGAWLVATRVGKAGLILLLSTLVGTLVPIGLLVLAAHWTDSTDMASLTRVPWRIATRSSAVVALGISVSAAIGPHRILEALSVLPLPAMVRHLLLQILLQAGTMLHETRRMTEAIQVRARGRWGTWRLILNVPGIWLPRVLDRSERVAMAMEVRGFGFGSTPWLEIPWRGVDLLALVAALGLVGLGWALR